MIYNLIYVTLYFQFIFGLFQFDSLAQSATLERTNELKLKNYYLNLGLQFNNRKGLGGEAGFVFELKNKIGLSVKLLHNTIYYPERKPIGTFCIFGCGDIRVDRLALNFHFLFTETSASKRISLNLGPAFFSITIPEFEYNGTHWLYGDSYTAIYKNPFYRYGINVNYNLLFATKYYGFQLVIDVNLVSKYNSIAIGLGHAIGRVKPKNLAQY